MLECQLYLLDTIPNSKTAMSIKKSPEYFQLKNCQMLLVVMQKKKKYIVFRKKYEDTKEAIGSRKWPKRKRTQRQIIIYKGQNKKLKIEQ